MSEFHSLDLVSQEPPVIGRLPEHSLGFRVPSLFRQIVALNGLGAKVLCTIHDNSVLIRPNYAKRGKGRTLKISRSNVKPATPIFKTGHDVSRNRPVPGRRYWPL
jgi:hypothetical protein